MTFKFVNAASLTSLLLLPAFMRAQEKPDSTATPTPLTAVVVSATRSERSLESLPSPVTVIGTPEIKMTSAFTAGDLLRTIPGFALRDFQSALLSGPGRGIVTFRGLGGSATGRVLVLLDGVPMGDPFSGWMDWGRIPLSMLASAEVIRGGGAVIWGSRALGGVVNLRTVTPRRDELRLTAERGSFNTSHGAGTATIKRGKLSALLAADYIDTDGFNITPPAQAGPADVPMPLRNRLVTGKVNYDLSPALQVWTSGSSYRSGEPPYGIADDIRFNEARAGARWLSPSRGVATLSLFANNRIIDAKAFSINADRTASTPQRFGKSPAESEGVFAQWTQVVRDRHEISTGVDFTNTGGSYTERSGFVNNVFTQQRRVAGIQQFSGAFVQDAADLGHSFRLVASMRFDRVHSFNGRRTERTLPTQALVRDSTIADHNDQRLTWSLGLRRQQASWLALRANAYDGFRAPSLFEMFYPRFSSKGTVTEANSQLQAERLRGVEGGFDVEIGSNMLARVTGFANRVASPILDITVGTAGNAATVIPPCGLVAAKQTCSQRRNVPGLRSNGLESDFSWRPSIEWRLNGGYSYNATRVRAPGQPVDGKKAIRSAGQAATAGISFDKPQWFSASIEARYAGTRFDDDLNTIKLDPFTVLGLRVNREFGNRVTAHLKVENLFDRKFDVSRTKSGLIELGAPRWVTAGLSTRW